jgi:hypothetical protein
MRPPLSSVEEIVMDAVPPAERDKEASVEAPLTPQAAATWAQEDAKGIAKEAAAPVAQ